MTIKKHKISKVTRKKGKPEIVNKKRSTTKSETFKVPYGKGDKTVGCKKENCKGELKRMQWNRLLCTVCNHSELI